MSFMIALCALVGAIGALNLLLTFGVIRRLREHENSINKNPSGNVPTTPRLIIGMGESVGDFSTSDITGAPLTRSDVKSGLIGFFTPGCSPCEERLPAFVRQAGLEPGGAERVVAVVAGTEEQTAELVRELAPVARVVVEDLRGPLTTAFQVRGFPAAVRLDASGVVVADEQQLAGIMRPVLVP